MTAEARFPRSRAFDADYWLCRCEGFRVDSPAGRLGVVDGLRFRSRVDRPDAIAVRAGLLKSHVLIVPVDEIAECLPRDGRIVLRRAPSSDGSNVVRTLRAHLHARRTRIGGGSEA